MHKRYQKVMGLVLCCTIGSLSPADGVAGDGAESSEESGPITLKPDLLLLHFQSFMRALASEVTQIPDRRCITSPIIMACVNNIVGLSNPNEWDRVGEALLSCYCKADSQTSDQCLVFCRVIDVGLFQAVQRHLHPEPPEFLPLTYGETQQICNVARSITNDTRIVLCESF